MLISGVSSSVLVRCSLRSGRLRGPRALEVGLVGRFEDDAHRVLQTERRRRAGRDFDVLFASAVDAVSLVHLSVQRSTVGISHVKTKN